MDSNLITLNGNEIYYESYLHAHSKKTVVLLHGFLSSTFSFRHLIPLLKTEFSVISVDLPPFGKSGKSTSYIYSYENHSMTIIKLCESLQLKDIIIIGHSMGGQIALNIAYLRPDLIAQCVLLCSSAYLQKSKRSLIMSSYLPFFHLFIKRYLEKSGVEKNLRNVVYDHSKIDKEMEKGYLEPFLEDRIFHALTRMIRDREGDLPNEKLHEIHTPCLLIWGEHDKVVPLHIGKQLHKDLKNSKLIVLKETGHLVPEEKPEEVLFHIKNFVNEYK
ncbi:alpha/beta fold hydrolase [Cytobacillus solani]|uniref:Hydrolase n=1 Tax=Cytobacillus solani TaxID=1637975 RepID=A0A0Q3QTY9_9BACI|nr:alpha/beta hydrolase [Cytobacillus solani]KOP80075.1 hydrolase [Bacillus sp. FJAT-21945]KQL21040.1 hydrolase [Cytobacillus solani]USK54289.1 alpha/beta hydrolase [Cytobacillus solani]